MEMIILFGAGFIGIIIVVLGFLSIAIRKVSAPSKELNDRIDRLENELYTLKD